MTLYQMDDSEMSTRPNHLERPKATTIFPIDATTSSRSCNSNLSSSISRFGKLAITYLLSKIRSLTIFDHTHDKNPTQKKDQPSTPKVSSSNNFSN